MYGEIRAKAKKTIWELLRWGSQDKAQEPGEGQKRNRHELKEAQKSMVSQTPKEKSSKMCGVVSSQIQKVWRRRPLYLETLKALVTSGRAVLGKGTRVTILAPGVGPTPLESFKKSRSGLCTFIQDFTQHTASCTEERQRT